MVFIYFLIVIMCVMSMMFTILVYGEKYIKSILKNNQQKNPKRISKMAIKVKVRKNFYECIFLSNWKKWRINLSIFSFALLLIFDSFNVNLSNNLFSQILKYVLLFFTFYGIGLFIHFSIPGSIVMKLLFYFLKLIIIFIYLLTLFESLIHNLENYIVLFSIIVLSIAFSLLFIKNVIDSFPSYFFQFINFVMIILLNFFVIGMTFGSFYISNDQQFSFFNIESYEDIFNSNRKLDIIFTIIYIGTIPIFNFPNELGLNKSTGILPFIPLIEHFIGYIFNLLVVGFFVSYSVSKLIERQSVKKENI